MTNALQIKVPAPRTPLVESALRLLTREITERCGAGYAVAGNRDTLVLAIEPGNGAEGFRIEDGGPGEIRIIGSDERGLLYGAGKLLRASRFDEGRFTPGGWRGASAPVREVRGIYFATHFFNYYHVAPVEQVVRYIEELALWGCNALCVWFDMHHYAGIRDPKAQRMIARLRVFLQAAQRVGITPGLLFLANEAYADSPEALRASAIGAYGVELCPSKPGAVELMLVWREEMLDAFADIDIGFIGLWPHDQGGCDCAGCAPWGANGFPRMSEPLAHLSRRYFPRAKIFLSTWWFDTHVPGEWAGLSRTFAERPAWVDYLMADGDHGSFPAYPLEHGAPGRLPMLNFPEISMYGIYPWGGWGANPLPHLFQRIWDSIGDRIAGGFPYSEGNYEDINKVLALQHYWNPARPTLDVLREYCAYEFTPDAAADLARAAELMERNHPHKWVLDEATGKRISMVADAEAARECAALVDGAETRMTPAAKAAWRWRIFRLRAAIDAELVDSGGVANARIDAWLNELTQLYAMHPNGRHAPIRKSTGWTLEDELARGPDEE